MKPVHIAVKINNIVIADDDADDIEHFKNAVQELCPDVILTIATNGEELMEILHNNPLPDAVILDLNMPLKSGLECLKEIKGNKKFNTVSVIILSTSNSKSDRYECFSAGADHYSYKPFSYDGLKLIVKQLCDGELIN